MSRSQWRAFLCLCEYNVGSFNLIKIFGNWGSSCFGLFFLFQDEDREQILKLLGENMIKFVVTEKKTI